MKHTVYFPPEAEVIEIRQEERFLDGTTIVGRADNEYDDNELEDM